MRNFSIADIGCVIRKRHEICRILQESFILIRDAENDVFLFEEPFDIAGIFTTQKHIREVDFILVFLPCGKVVFRTCRFRVGKIGIQHHADLNISAQGGCIFFYHSRSHQFVVNALIFILFQIGAFVLENAQMIEGLVANEVNLVKRDPVLNAIVIAIEASAGKVKIKID
ncbi:Uncharacterised protein [Klebsiella pneumoniae]|nr:Uncharacterised protein [Klebsiella pneumoniae]